MKYLKILTTVIFVSCSWQNFNPFAPSDTSTDKVIKNFDLDDDIVDKFTTSQVAERKEQKAEIAKEDKSGAKAKVEKNKPGKKQKKSNSKKQVINKVIVEDVKISKSPEPKSIYPADYPEEFKNYDKKSKAIWDKIREFNPVGEQMFMDITYMGVVVGKIAIMIKPQVMIGDEEVYHYYAKLKSAPFYKYVYTLDDVIESYVRVKDYLPVKYSLVQRESKQSIDDIQLFDRDKLMTYFRLKKVKRGKKSFKKADTFIPFYSQDALSSIFMLRALPLKVGDKFDIPIVTRGKISLMKLDVLGVEKIKTSIGEKSAFKIAANTQYSGDLVKSGSMTFWISADDERIFLKFNSEIKLGLVSGDIVDYKK